MRNYSSRKGFTLAEVLITLGIIGVVAAITIPTISKNIQQVVLKNQFKKFYSIFTQAVLGFQMNEGHAVNCFYWASGQNPYTGKCTPTCNEDEKNDYGACTTWHCAETGNPLPSDLNGRMSDCVTFHEKLFLDNLKTTKICKDHAYQNGCLPKDFRGTDIIYKEKNPDEEYNPNGEFADNSTKNNYPVYVLADGTYIIGYYRHLSGSPVYTVDINGHKGPNKWGYDIFSFKLFGNARDGIKGLGAWDYAIEPGGKGFDAMYKEVFNR